VHALATAAGCQLVASCDLAVAADTAGFAIPGGKGALFCHTPLVAVARKFGLPIHAIGVGEGIEDLRPFDADQFARILTGAMDPQS